MVYIFLVDDQKAIVGFCKMFNLNCGILLVVFLKVGFELFGDLAGEDCCFNARVSFGKQHQNTFIYLIVNQND